MYSIFLADDVPPTTPPAPTPAEPPTAPPPPLVESLAPTLSRQLNKFRDKKRLPQRQMSARPMGHQFAPPGYYQAQPQIVPQLPQATDAAAIESSKTRDWLIQGAIAAGAALLVAMLTSKK